MKKQLLWCMAALSFSAASAQTYETRFARPLSDVLNDVAARFQVRLKYDVDTVGACASVCRFPYPALFIGGNADQCAFPLRL